MVAPKTNTKPAATGSGTSSAAAKPASKAPRKTPVKVEDVEFLGEVSVVSVSEIPRVARARSGRKNPFDALLGASFERNDEATDKYAGVKVKTDQVDATSRLIRSAASFLEIGSKIYTDDHKDGTTTVYFRGQDRRTRKTSEK